MHVSVVPVKGYLRKGTNLLAMKETTKAADAYQKAMALDANCQVSLYCLVDLTWFPLF